MVANALDLVQEKPVLNAYSLPRPPLESWTRLVVVELAPAP